MKKHIYSIICNTIKRLIFCLCILLHLADGLLAQDCSNDSIPPQLFCKTNFIFCLQGDCGNGTIGSDFFMASATDECSNVKLSFDSEGKNTDAELIALNLEPNKTNYIPIYGRDSSGNTSMCLSSFEVNVASEFNVDYTLQSNLRDSDVTKFKLYAKNKEGETFPTYIDYTSSKCRFETNNCSEITSLLLDTTNSEIIEWYITGFDVLSMVKYITGKNKNISNFNITGLDVDCNGELNIVDLVTIIKYINGEKDLNINSCIALPFATFLDGQNEIIGNEISFDKFNVPKLNIGLGIRGDYFSTLIAPISNFVNPISEIINEPIELSLPDLHCFKGKSYSIDVDFTNNSEIQGIQFNINYNPNLILLDTISMLSQKGSFNKDQDIRMVFTKYSYSNVLNQPVTLNFIAKDDFRLSDAIHMEKPSISNMAVLSDGSIHPVKVTYHPSTGIDHVNQDNSFIFIENKRGNLILCGDLGSAHQCTYVLINVFGQTMFSTNALTDHGIIHEPLIDIPNGFYVAQVILPNGKKLTCSFIH